MGAMYEHRVRMIRPHHQRPRTWGSGFISVSSRGVCTGGVHGGRAIGRAMALGLHPTENNMHVRDIHASILHLLGLGNIKLTRNDRGRLERLTSNEGEFNRKLIGA
jgi:hypothetical protein